MIIRHAKIDNYGKLQNREFDFAPGINVIYGENEAGKSTLQSFLKSMLFGLEKTRRRNELDEYSRYEPWNVPAWFSGELEFSAGDQVFSLRRNFYRKEPDSRLINRLDGEELSVDQGDLEMLLGGVSREAYEHTLAVSGSGNYPGAVLADLLRDEMQNMARTGDNSFRLSRSRAYLEQKKRELNRRGRELQAERTRRTERLKDREEAIREELERLEERRLVLQDAQDRGQEQLRLDFFDEEEDRRENDRELGAEAGNDQPGDGREDDRPETGWHNRREEDRPETGWHNRRDDAEDLAEDDWYDDEDDAEDQPAGGRKWDPGVIIGVAGLLICGLLVQMHRFPGKAASVLMILFGVITIVSIVRLIVKGHHAPEDPEEDDPAEEERQEQLRAERERRREARREAQVERRIALAKNAGEKEALEEQIRERRTELSNLAEALRELEVRSEEETEIARSVRALDLAERTMAEQAEKSRGRMQGALEGRTSEILEQMTAGRYHETKANAAGVPVLADDSREVTVGALSAGTADQVWLAWRMAAGEILCREEPLPFLMDEIFSFYDDQRMAETLNWLAGQHHQIFLFCCQHREEQMLERLGIPFRLIRM